MRKKLKSFGNRTKNEESRNKELIRINIDGQNKVLHVWLMVKITFMENNNSENKSFISENAPSKGEENEKFKVIVDDKEN